MYILEEITSIVYNIFVCCYRIKYLIFDIAQNIPEFLDMVDESEFKVM